MPLRAASPASDDRGGTWIEQAPWSYGKPNVVVSVKHRPAAAIARLKNAELPFGSGYTTGGSNAGRSGADNQNVEIGLGS
jgi:hypothetical protein